MSFEYGSKEISIKNPFSLLGKLMLCSGGLTLLLGIILFLIISFRSNSLISGDGSNRALLFYNFIGAFILTAAGAAMAVKGLFMVNKFYVDDLISSYPSHFTV